MTPAVELNLDGLVGPTHHYGGLAIGNLASTRHHGATSNPRAAALQGLDKMKRAMALGAPQGVLPPAARPDLRALRSWGFGGDDAAMLRRARSEAPELLAAAYSASSMWVANAATVSPSADTADGRVHLSVANLASNLHRALEAPQTLRTLRRVFADDACFVVHPPLPGTPTFHDEGAANHMRLCPAHGSPGLEVFVHGSSERALPERFPARQSPTASATVARRHGVRHARLLQQHPAVIDQGVFHNDVIAVGHRDVLLAHERAFLDPRAVVELAAAFGECADTPLRVLAVSEVDLPVPAAVSSYLFNSQLLDGPGGLHLLGPRQCEEDPRARRVIDRWLADGSLAGAELVELRQSMQNGGGPACLRLRVVLTDAERAAMHQGVLLDEPRHASLVAWVSRHYRDRLRPEDLADPSLITETRTALDELTQLLDLGALYPFQEAGGAP